MTIPLNKLLDQLPKERQERILQQADQYIKEYKSLQALRKALGITQSDIATHQGIKQVNISNLEKRQDMHISTLRKYVEAMGCKLEITIRMPDQTVGTVTGL